MAAGLWPALIKRIAHVRGPVPGFSIRAYGSSLSLVLIERYSARARGVVGRGLEKAGILCGAWPYGTSRAHGGGLWPALIKRVAHVRGLVPGFSIRGAWPHGTNRAHSGGLWPALIERVVYVRGVWLVGDWKSLAIGEFGRAQCIWVGQNPRAGWGQGAVLGFLARLGGAETGLGRTVSSLALPKNWMQKTQEYQ